MWMWHVVALAVLGMVGLSELGGFSSLNNSMIPLIETFRAPAQLFGTSDAQCFQACDTMHLVA